MGKAKTAGNIKYKNKFYDDKGNDIYPVMKENKMLWYCEKTGEYHKTWFVKKQIKIGGRE